ncbi:uncharacterized protein ACLA_002040 [Aspergillus clavatus NRRL 1]|uniref:Cyclase n=1 Tax=Aspergillus clavatus (strain ATCC 1007 / CBS 513.65 / DSM 816 / NCTC 3887 / NRRL 1 / QM 1276 / 107) TaxID=344612 RepID=A1C525_ASPCL|nr:uncharacterized protein ACLA_002040 [Aspergillus clavatus NRRL 1]EAW14793.1 conserved hypothetical protein [Aspergillus clavatus NRRL 1]
MTPQPNSRPAFDNLTIDPSGPSGNAWGLFGASNELGMLNLLTPESVHRAASEEIREGVRFSLDLPLDRIKNPSFGRKPFARELVNKGPRIVNDDILRFNTQCRNHTHKCYFNGHSLEELKISSVIGIDAWVKHGGIVGRGVLIDYASWATTNSVTLSPFTTSKISLSSIQQIIAEKKIHFRPGDILFLRTGFTAAYDQLSAEEELAIAQRETPQFAGLEAGEATLRWLWENQFAAVASDSPSFEPAPIAGPDGPAEFQLHQWLLAGWGMPIGEYFDLEGVAEHCRKTNRWSFFLSSVPLNVPGGAASPPNAVAIF